MDLMKQGKVTITSNDIARETGKEHSKVMRDIRTIINELKTESPTLDSEIWETYYKGSRRNEKNYTMTEDFLMLVITGYSVTHRMKLIKYCRELENELKNQHKIPTTFIEAMQLALDQAKELEKKEMQLVEQRPKVEYHDKVLESSECLTTTQVAEQLGMTARKLNSILNKQLGVQYKVNGQWVLYSDYKGKGYTRTRKHIYTYSTGKERVSSQTVWTEKGQKMIINKIEDLRNKLF